MLFTLKIKLQLHPCSKSKLILNLGPRDVNATPELLDTERIRAKCPDSDDFLGIEPNQMAANGIFWSLLIPELPEQLTRTLKA